MNLPVILIAGTTSSVGKTTITLAIISQLINNHNLKVQSFKVGPDFIDPSYHTMITGRTARNLDIWMMGKKGIIDCFNNSCSDADVAVIEGVMGLYDGMNGNSNYASTAHIAKMLDADIVLVIDGSKASRSIAAIAYGFIKFDKSIKIRGIIINNIGSDKHEKLIREAFQDKIKIPIIGMIKRNKSKKVEERHLGLITTNELERDKQNQTIEYIKEISTHLDINLLNIKYKKTERSNKIPYCQPKTTVKIGVALDESFNFYYYENLETLRKMGADIVFFSPISDREIPKDIDGIIIGGGFPEILADKLERNESMKNSILKFGTEGKPVVGECGGLMYLTKTITGYKDDNQKRRMVGLVDAETSMTKKLTLSYIKADAKKGIFGTINNIKGHEFHYSTIYNIPIDTEYAFVLSRGNGIDKQCDGIITYNSIASYLHLHYSDKRIPKKIIESCIKSNKK